MTTQPSVNIPDDLFAELYRRAPQPDARTALIAEALRCFFATHDAANSDLEILNRYADELNQEAQDILDFHVCGFSPRFSRAGGSRGTNHRLQVPYSSGGGLIRRKRFRRGFIPRQLNLPALAGKSLRLLR